MSTTTNDTDARLIAALDAYIPEALRITGTPGANIALARGGRLIWEAGFGYADLQRKLPMRADTVMRTGSMGKLYTATAVMQLVEQGALGLYDPINQHLPEFQVDNPLGERPISVYDLLTHRSGVTSDAAGSDFAPAPPLGEHLAAEARRRMLREYSRSVPRWSAKVGERFQYSNFGVALLGYLVEIANPQGLAFPDYVQQHIFDPLGMTSTQFSGLNDAAHLRPELAERLSTGYARLGPLYLPTPMIYLGEYPAGSSVTTPADHLRLLLAYLNSGELRGRRILRAETVERVLTPQVELAPGHNEYTGLIWRVGRPDTPEHNFGHSGAYMYGWDNGSRAFPRRDFAVVIMTNAWDMLAWDDPRGKRLPALVPHFIANWLAREDAGAQHARPAASWPWKVSYVSGLLLAEQLKGALGIPSPLTCALVEAMLAGAATRDGSLPPAERWDPDGFRAGIEDMLATELTQAGIRAFVACERLKLLPEELELISRELGGWRERPLPWAG